MEKILLTGATGFLGSHIVERCDFRHYEVYCLVRESSDLTFIKKFPVKLIIGNLENVIEATTGISFDYIIHAAALMSSETDPTTLIKVNVEGTKRIIDLAAQISPKRLIYISSVVAIGTNLSPKAPLLTEESFNITKGLNYLGHDSKRLAEEEVIKKVQSKRIRAIVLNPSIMYGARDVLKPVRKIDLQAARGKLKYYVEGGVNIVPVKDVVDTVFNSLTQGQDGERYILGGENILIKDLYSRISLLNNKKGPFLKIPVKKLFWLANLFSVLKIKTSLTKEHAFTYTSFHWVSSEKAKKELNFRPSFINDALLESIQYMKEKDMLRD